MLKTPAILLVSALVALPAAGCMTKRVHMEPSAAVKEARARAQSLKAHPVALCSTVTLDAQSPLVIPFGYEKTELSESGGDILDGAADWLTCHPANYAAVVGEPDPTGSKAHQEQLAAERVKTVRAYLANRGVAPARVLDGQPKGGGQVLTITARGRGW